VGHLVLISLQTNDLRFYRAAREHPRHQREDARQSLRTLVQDGLVWRQVEPTTPPQVTYGLTEFGRDIGERWRSVRPHHTTDCHPRDTE